MAPQYLVRRAWSGQVLGNCQVFVLAVVGVVLFRERLDWRLLVSIPLAVIGLTLIVGPSWLEFDDRYRLGVVFGLATALAYAVYILSLRRARLADPEGKPGRDLAIASLVSAFFLGLLALVEGVSLVPTTALDVGLLATYGLVAQVFGWMLISSALGQVPASRVGLILLLQPALAFVWDVLFFARPVTGFDAMGAGLTLTAIYLGSRTGASGAKPSSETDANAEADGDR